MQLEILKPGLLVTFIALNMMGWSQERETGLSSDDEQRMENRAERNDADTEDDSYWQQLDYFRMHPLNLNNADESRLQELHLLTDLQISNFLHYRKLLGKLIDIYELQAVPAWDIITIERVLRFVTIDEQDGIMEKFRKRFHGGTQSLLLRISESVEKSAGFIDPGAGSYLGGRLAAMCRYVYNYKNLLQFGITGDKDAGEQFFKGVQSAGFDFYSFHLFVRNLGHIKSIALGDFTVNLGQGLIQWGALAFKKSAAVLDIKRQSTVLRPYTAAGEYNFHRGAGITWQHKKMEATVFGSLRNMSANLVTDSLYNKQYISSLQTSGYHRTVSELADRNNLHCFTTGANLNFSAAGWHAGINLIQYYFSKPFQSSGEPYDIFALAGKNWSNYSIDYSYTFRNTHVYGEIAADKNYNMAILNGILISLDTKTDLAIVHRQISKAYQSLFSNAFTENTLPSNENGLYTGISVRPLYGWKIDAYADFFQFPWLKYRVDAPSTGSDYLFQITYTPGKQAEMYSRFRRETKAINVSDAGLATGAIEQVMKQSWRTQISYKLTREILLRSRMEIVWFDINTGDPENGFLSFWDIHYKPSLRKYAADFRIQYFETTGYNARIYAYESSGLYSFSIPAFFNKGTRYSLNINYNMPHINFNSLLKSMECRVGMYIARTVNPSAKTDIKLQMIISGR